MSVVTISPVFLTGAFGAEISRDLDLGPAALGGLAAVFFGITGITATPLGRLADRWGGRVAGRWAVLASAVSLLLAAAGDSYGLLALAMGFGGVGNGLGGPTANMILSDRIRERSLGLAFGIKQSAVPSATLVAGLAIPLFVNQFGWRATMAGAGVVGLLVILIVPDGGGGGDPTAPARTFKGVMSRTTVLTGLAFLFGIAAATSLTTLLTSSAVDAGLSSTFAGLVLSAGSVGAMVVRITSGRAADRNHLDPAKASALMMAFGALGFVAISLEGAVAIAAGAFIAYAIGWGWSGLLVLNLMKANPHAPGSATGVVLTGAASGGIFGPLLTGSVAEQSGFPLAWLVAAVLAVLGASAAWAGTRKGPDTLDVAAT